MARHRAAEAGASCRVPTSGEPALKIAVVGTGAVGARAARQLAGCADVDGLLLADAEPARARGTAEAIGELATAVDLPLAGDADLVAAVLAGPAGTHVELARSLMTRGIHVVSVSDGMDDVMGLLELGPEARERGVTIAAGAGFTPGLSCVLACHAAAGFDRVDEVHVAHSGTAGPACARQHHDALTGHSVDWRDGGWVRRRAGSGRELCWFPEPVGPVDCYRAVLPDPLLLVRAFPGIERVTARVSATRRDRFTSHLPMLRRPHPDGGPGAIRVEVRGRRSSAIDTYVLGVIDRPSIAAGAVAAVTAVGIATGEFRRPGAGGLAGLVEPLPFLSELARRGVKAAVFEGDAVPAHVK